ncbi:YheC/YheD family endospore coat-associated protein [Numidum massiliense]|uniref:YheC/YheD family endospore coat-associated protein n=1 Tax=Numidum massiliense TaxID=1522315 RepID=UPI0006D52F8C|nr:YheC/YheD family protein [Numidum massiliense]
MNQVKLQLFISPDTTFPTDVDFVLPQLLTKKWRLSSREPLVVSCGSASNIVRVAPSQRANKSRMLRMRASLARLLGLYGDGAVNIRYFPQHHRLQLGPLLGVLTNGINSQAAHDQRFGSMTRFYNECQQAALLRGIRLYVFTAEDLDVQGKQINGWVNVNGCWEQHKCPLPEVVYNRITSRRIEAGEHLQQKIQWLKRRYPVQLFNEQFLDKWQVHSALWHDAKMRPILPVTRPYDKIMQLRDMLKQYETVYVKPVNGSLGQGVMRLTSKGGRYHMQYTTLNSTITKKDLSLKEVAQHMARRSRQGKYLMQQGLQLITSLNRNIDFRALVQKNGRGQWTITSIVGRIAADTSIVSNLARGGTIAPVSHILQQVDPNLPKPTLPSLRGCALQVAHVFEQQINGHFAELGIDLAVDKKGKVWLLEINSKPSKTDDAIANAELLIRPSVHKTMDYTLYVTKFPLKSRSRSIRTKTKVIR